MKAAVSPLFLAVLIYAGMAYVTGFVLGLTICRDRDDDITFEYVFSLLWPMSWVFFIETAARKWRREHPGAAKRVGRAIEMLNPAEMGRCVADRLDKRARERRGGAE